MKSLTAAALLCLGSTNAFADFSYGINVIPTLEEHEFRGWMRKFGKSYQTKEEYLFRYQVFRNNLKEITKTEERHENYHEGLNQWSDMTEDDFGNIPIVEKSEAFLAKDEYPPVELLGDVELPESINWVERGYITGVKETDYDCTVASYAFAAADTVEALYKKQTGRLQELSTKQMMDCGGAFSLVECQAGRIEKAFEYIQAGNKLEYSHDYPYNRHSNQCSYDKQKGKAGIGSIRTVQIDNDPKNVKKALLNGPVASMISMAKPILRYESGVITPADNCNQNLRIYVVIVGYGKEQGEEYFLVKNNWGTDWGENGYVKISTSSQNVCGLLTPGFLY